MFLLCKFLMFFLFFFKWLDCLCFSLSKQAKNTHCPDDRHTTADRFYALNLDAKQAAEHHLLFDSAVVGEEAEEAVPESPRQHGALKRKMKKPCKLPAKQRSPSTSPPSSVSPPHAEKGQESRESASVSPISHGLV